MTICGQQTSNCRNTFATDWLLLQYKGSNQEIVKIHGQQKGSGYITQVTNVQLLQYVRNKRAMYLYGTLWSVCVNVH